MSYLLILCYGSVRIVIRLENEPLKCNLPQSLSLIISCALESNHFCSPLHYQSSSIITSPHTTDAISSQSRSLRSHSSCCTSACACQHVQYPPPALFRTPFPCFTQSANPHDEAHRTQPSSNEQHANHCQVTALWLPFHPRKPLDAHYHACRTPARI